MSLPDNEVSRQIIDKFNSSNVVVSFAEIAKASKAVGRKGLATQVSSGPKFAVIITMYVCSCVNLPCIICQLCTCSCWTMRSMPGIKYRC